MHLGIYLRSKLSAHDFFNSLAGIGLLVQDFVNSIDDWCLQANALFIVWKY